MTEPNRTCLSYWFPLIEAAGLPVPRTEIVKTDCQLIELLDGKTPDGFQRFRKDLMAAVLYTGLPCFLRTGLTSNKHEWRDTCYLIREEDLEQHVFKLIEFSAMCDFAGLATDVWVVREMIPTTPAFVAFRGMPIVREFRVFTRDNKARCIHPYWPIEAIRTPSVDDWEDRLEDMSEIYGHTIEQLSEMAEEAAQATGYGDWSIDFLEDSSGKWWLTDMAEADRSWHWPGCGEAV